LTSFAPYAYVRLVVNDSISTFTSQDVVFLLQGLQTYDLQVTSGASYKVQLYFEEFSLVDPALSSQGLFVLDFDAEFAPYVISDIYPIGSIAPASTPCYYRSIPGGNYQFDADSFNQALIFGADQTTNCGKNSGNCQLNTGKLAPLLITENLLSIKLNPFYSYRLASFSSQSHVVLNFDQPLAINAQVISYAKTVVSIESYANVILGGAGSFSICGSGTKSMWIAGTNIGSAGFSPVFLSIVIGDVISDGDVYFPGGPFNVTIPLPVYANDITVCVTSLTDNCVDFFPFCQEEVIPTQPDTDNSSGSVSGSGNKLNWLIYLFIALACLFALVCLFCVCFIAFRV